MKCVKSSQLVWLFFIISFLPLNAQNKTAKEINTFKKAFDQAIENHQKDVAAYWAYQTLLRYYDSRPVAIRRMKEKFRNTFNENPFQLEETNLSTFKRNLQLEQRLTIEEQKNMSCNTDTQKLRKHLTQTVEDNIRLRSKLFMLQLKEMRPELQAIKTMAQRAKKLDTRVRKLHAQVEEARKREQRAHHYAEELKRLNQNFQESYQKQKQQPSSTHTLTRIKELETKLKSAETEAQKAQQCDQELKRLEPQYKTEQMNAQNKIKGLETQIEGLQKELKETKEDVEISQTCEKELTAAQTALEDTIRQLRTMLI